MAMAITHAGAKDHPVTLQQKTEQRTASGGVELTWTDKYKVMASRKDMRGGEGYEASQKVGYGSTTWRIWFRDGIDSSSWRIKDEYSHLFYDIIAPPVMIGRRQELELLTEIRDND